MDNATETRFNLLQQRGIPPLLEDPVACLSEFIQRASGVRRNTQKVFHFIARCSAIIEDMKVSVEGDYKGPNEMSRVFDCLERLQDLLTQAQRAVDAEIRTYESLSQEALEETWDSSREIFRTLLTEAYHEDFQPPKEWQSEIEHVGNVDDHIRAGLKARLNHKQIIQDNDIATTTGHPIDPAEVTLPSASDLSNPHLSETSQSPAPDAQSDVSKSLTSQMAPQGPSSNGETEEGRPEQANTMYSHAVTILSLGNLAHAVASAEQVKDAIRRIPPGRAQENALAQFEDLRTAVLDFPFSGYDPGELYRMEEEYRLYGDLMGPDDPDPHEP
ncbi:hypothetical protein FRB90_002150 [Tulasnella sp. 427]|nr:hypothetical protein FRB90_002150 [Tulasnella sp. 427]